MMTGLQTDKTRKLSPANEMTESTMVDTRRRKRRQIVSAVVASIVTSVVMFAVGLSLFYGTGLWNSKMAPTREAFFVQISESPKDATVKVNKAERIIVTESKSSDDKLDHTMTLQDFNKGLQAVKDFKRKACYVLPLLMNYEDSLKVAEEKISTNPNETVPVLEKVQSREAIPSELLSYAVGQYISKFCFGLPTYWLTGDTKGELQKSLKRQKRRKVYVSYYTNGKVKIILRNNGNIKIKIKYT